MKSLEIFQQLPGDRIYDDLRGQTTKGQRSTSVELEEASLGTSFMRSLSNVVTAASSGATLLIFFSDSTQVELTNLFVMKNVMVLRSSA